MNSKRITAVFLCVWQRIKWNIQPDFVHDFIKKKKKKPSYFQNPICFSMISQVTLLSLCLFCNFACYLFQHTTYVQEMTLLFLPPLTRNKAFSRLSVTHKAQCSARLIGASDLCFLATYTSEKMKQIRTFAIKLTCWPFSDEYRPSRKVTKRSRIIVPSCCVWIWFLWAGWQCCHMLFKPPCERACVSVCARCI